MNKKTIAEIKEKLTAMPISYLYLFGSKATGKATKRSDTDFAVKFNSRVRDAFLERCKLIDILSRILKTDNIDVVDFDSAPPLLKFNIIKDGKVLYSRNEKERIMDKARALSVYFDRQYYLDRHVKRTLERLSK